MSYSKQLKLALDERKMLPAQLSAKTGIPRSSMSNYIHGKTVPSVETIQKIATALKMPVEFFDEYEHEDKAQEKDTPCKVTVKRAAAIMGKSEKFVQIAIQRGLVPFGVATKMNGCRYTYYISPKAFREYTGALV